MKKRLIKLMAILSVVLIATTCFVGCGNSNIIKVKMSDKTRSYLEAMGFDNVKALQQDGWGKSTLPELQKRTSGYVPMPTKDYYGNPLLLKTEYNDKFLDMDFVSSFTPKDKDYDKIVMYLHGGAYINGAEPSHTTYCDNIAYNNNALVVAPNYGLTPQCNYVEAYTMLNSVYDELLKLNKPLIIMGDSAGGGLATSYTLYLKALNKQLPKKVVLISPWLDLTLTNSEIPNYQQNDRMLAPYGLIEAGKLWAGEDTKDYKVSPINGDYTGFPETLIFMSTWEIFYPDEVKFVNILKDKKVKFTVAELEGFIHVAPLFGSFEEYNELQKIVSDFIK